MITIAWYLLKVIIGSGILCGYYFLALRNKVFHRWNRFYLLAAIVISLLAPVMKINIFQNNGDNGSVVKVLQTISYGDETVIAYSRNSGFQLNTQNIAEGAYGLVSMIFLFILFASLYKIIRLKKKYPQTKIEGISFITTNAKGTPFSFFNSIFWNNAIDLHSRPGQQIFNHEIAHVKEKHSYDKIFMNVVLIFFWINPFFWLMRQELYMIHEFVADQKALKDSDLNSFAEMVLQSVYPGQNFSITNNFFYSSLKRRLLMLTKNKNPKASYLSRLLVLPVSAMVFFAFALKVKTANEAIPYDGKTITVVIDAGHGGYDHGALSANGLVEKDITLAIAKKISGLNSNEHIKILLSRDNDQSISVKDRVEFAKEKNADLFISIHVNAIDVNTATKNEPLIKNGFSVLIDKNEGQKNILIASSLIEELKKSYTTADKIGNRKNKIWVLDANTCPAALIECGYLTDPNDEAFITNNANQEKIAKNVLDAIAKYAINSYNSDSKNVTTTNNSEPNTSMDTIPAMYYKNKKVTGLGVNDSTNTVKVRYHDGSGETITIEEARKRGFVPPPPPPPNARMYHGKLAHSVEGIGAQKVVIHFKDGTMETITRDEAKKAGFILFTPPKKAQKDNASDKMTKGVLLVSPPDNIQIQADKLVDLSVPEKNHVDPMKAVLIINGTMVPNQTLKKKSITAKTVTIYQGDKPGLINKYGDKAKNGVIIFEDATIKDTPQLSEKRYTNDTGKIFTKVENEASFPGGSGAWVKYIVKEIRASIDSFTEADYGTCILRFVVNTDGTLNDVKATTMQGTKLAEIAVNAVRKGPKWIPATQNGHTVASYRLQPVTLTNPDANDKVFIKMEKTAQFPGGQSAWLKYITRIIQKNSSELTADKKSSGTCNVRFIVKKDGSVNNVQAMTMKGTKLAERAINAIRQGPKWIPATQDGHTVASYRLQPVTFQLNDDPLNKTEPK